MSPTPNWLLYGAYGYTGELIARECRRRGLHPILGGRDAARLEGLAQALEMPHRAFALDDPAAVARELAGVHLVLSCAGPFAATAPALMDACIAARAHYLDVSGEISVFERAQASTTAAAAANVVLCPGVGFDVIPTDCVAAALKAALPDASSLALGFDTRSPFSPGTAKTSFERLAVGGAVRAQGRIVTVPLAHKTRRIDFGAGTKLAMCIPWGDVATAWYTTGIPNIEVYVPTSQRLVSTLHLVNLLRPLLRLHPVQRLVKRRIGRKVHGPGDALRARTPTYVWGEVHNEAGSTRTARIEVANGYDVTVAGALAITHSLLGEPRPGGAYTPARLMGADFITTLPGSGSLHLE
jgi:short subunit dehydrogenase-like uncharacterized protein